MNALYVGTVHHRRIRPRPHRFAYGAYWLYLDLDDLAGADRSSRLLSVDRPNLFSFRQSDHGPGDGSSLKEWITALARRADLDIGRVHLLTFPRLFGYAFNPLSIWYCEGPEGSLAAVLYEVRNTFGERHSYFLPVNAPGPVVHEWNKEFFVSPFIGMDARYRFELEAPDSRLRVVVHESDPDGPLFNASMGGVRRELGTRSLMKVFFTHPLLTFRVTIGIHWHALRLWIKKAPYRSRPPAPSHRVSMPRQVAP